LNCRILWSFSAGFNLTANPGYLGIAERAFQYITENFIDKDHQGVFWSVDYTGQPLDTKKQMYALSFAIYGLSEFSLATNNKLAKDYAIELYHAIVRHSYDSVYGGYIEALSAEWTEINDLRLSNKDANEKKSMNTHLHVLEGFANLYKVWPDRDLKKRIEELIHIFLDRIIDKATSHLTLFFDANWEVRSSRVSYGHDIEAAWLLLQAGEIIGDRELTDRVKIWSVKVAHAAAEGLDRDGGLWYEFDPVGALLVKEKHWWPQAEGMVGFFNTWQITGEEDYLLKSFGSWQFIREHLLDASNGEWFWGVDAWDQPMEEDKVGIWKCPYHNTRACIEIVKRINTLVLN
jgi:mannobiose 2-epimerase